MKHYNRLDIAGVESLAADPVTNLFVGRAYFNTTSNTLRVYTGTAWATFSTAGALDDLSDVTIGTAGENNFLVYKGSAWQNQSAANARTDMGLGSMATVNSPAPVANGGTGATSALGARINLGLGTAAEQSYTFSGSLVSFYGPFASSPDPYMTYYTKIGRLVTVTIENSAAYSFTTDGTVTTFAVLPPPVHALTETITGQAFANGSWGPGRISLNTSGALTIHGTVASTFKSGTAQWIGLTFSYISAS